MSSNITIKEIAELANVSPSAVSLVLNNKGGVSSETRSRVQNVLKEYNYVPNRKVKKKAGGNYCFLKYSTHGMAMEANPGFDTAIMDQIERSCSEIGANIIVRSMNPANVATVLPTLRENPVDGIFLLGTELRSEQLALMRMIDSPIVVVDNSMRNCKIDCVAMANHDIANEAVRYLYQLGFREIGYLQSDTYIANFHERTEGFHNCISELGLREQETYQLTPTLNGAYSTMKKLLQGGHVKLPQALFADNDTIAIGAMKALKEYRVNIPGDVSIIGVEDINYSSIVSPGLTTIRISRSHLAMAAVEMMQRRIRFPNEAPCRMRIGGTLIVRGSTADEV